MEGFNVLISWNLESDWGAEVKFCVNIKEVNDTLKAYFKHFDEHFVSNWNIGLGNLPLADTRENNYSWDYNSNHGTVRFSVFKVHLELKKFDIWMEGYLDQGMEGIPAPAHQVAKDVPGFTFEDACASYFENDSDPRKLYDRVTNTYWGCKLYDNEDAARILYG